VKSKPIEASDGARQPAATLFFGNQHGEQDGQQEGQRGTLPSWVVTRVWVGSRALPVLASARDARPLRWRRRGRQTTTAAAPTMLADGYRVTIEHQQSHWWYRARRDLFLRVRRAEAAA